MQIEFRDSLPFYADMAAQVIKEERELRESGRYDEATLLRKIACYPHSTWIIGDDDYEKTLKKVERVIQSSKEKGINHG